MTRETLLAEILRLPVEDQLELIGDAWDALTVPAEQVPVPRWHVRELKERLEHPDPEYLDWEEARTRLRERG